MRKLSNILFNKKAPAMNDLLDREPIQLETEKLNDFIGGKKVLITGAGGSIGSELCRQVCRFNPKQLLLLDQAENPLFYIEQELKPLANLVPLVCNIADRKRVGFIFSRYSPDIVFHAAAHKHVPLMEANPGEAVKNNVLGTQIIAEIADWAAVDSFVMLSTDKAVNPSSIMGASKRIAEMLIQYNPRFKVVRFGNVLGSEGSVLTIFKKQLEAGGPLTVTHPEMKRYFMTIPEASQLVLQAAAMGKGGETFVLDMGDPIKIVDIAKRFIRLNKSNAKIVFTGPRPGEKLFEELRLDGEEVLATDNPKINIWRGKEFDKSEFRRKVFDLIRAALSNKDVVLKIKEIIPEYMGSLNITHEVDF